MAPLPKALLLLSLALPSLAFSFRSPSQPPTDLLAGAFPPNARLAPSYSTVLQYLSTLETAPSCHREATTSLISDCSILEASHSDLRYRYASRLAVCEFEATGVNYPSECRNGRHEKCIKRLEERPQWWTTLSNNIQNVLVICAAVRHEVEEGRILELHRNATRAQEMLIKVANGALQIMRAQQDREELEKREFGEGWRGIFEAVKMDMIELQVDAKIRAREDGEALKRMFDGLLQRVINGHQEYSERQEELALVLRSTDETSLSLTSKVGEIGEAMMTTLTKLSTAQIEKMLEAQQGIESINSALSSAAGLSERLDTTTLSLSSKIEMAALNTNKLSSLSEVYSSLAATQSSIADSQTELAERQQRVIHSLESLGAQIENMLFTLSAKTDRLEKSLENAVVWINPISGMGNKRTMAVVILAVSLAVWLGQDNWCSATGVVGVLFGLWILAKDLELHAMLKEALAIDRVVSPALSPPVESVVNETSAYSIPVTTDVYWVGFLWTLFFLSVYVGHRSRTWKTIDTKRSTESKLEKTLVEK